MELLRKLLNDEIKARSREEPGAGPLVRRDAGEGDPALPEPLDRDGQVIEELIELAKEMREAHQRGEDLGLTEDELAFYDALEVNDSAVKVLGDETLRDHRPRTGRDRAATT